MDRDTAVKMAQAAIKTQNKRLVEAVLKIKAERGQRPASNDDLADLEKIHPLWSYEKKLRSWGIDEIKPRKKA